MKHYYSGDGLVRRIKFLDDPVLAKITVIVVNIWVGVPYTMLLTSGILMNIPTELYESAKIDGAGPVRNSSKLRCLTSCLLQLRT